MRTWPLWLAGSIAAVVAVMIGFALLVGTPVKAHDAKDPHAAWFKAQRINPETNRRLGTRHTSCCDKGDHLETRFRLVEDGSKYGVETYEYEWRGKWRVIPQDVIQHKKTPDGRPVLFMNKITGEEYCFIIDKEGI